MPLNGKHRFSEKQHRQAMHIKESEMKRGKSEEAAERIGWATLSKRKKRGLSALKHK
jgi:hypothetical protein